MQGIHNIGEWVAVVVLLLMWNAYLVHNMRKDNKRNDKG